MLEISLSEIDNFINANFISLIKLFYSVHRCESSHFDCEKIKPRRTWWLLNRLLGAVTSCDDSCAGSNNEKWRHWWWRAAGQSPGIRWIRATFLADFSAGSQEQPIRTHWTVVTTVTMAAKLKKWTHEENKRQNQQRALSKV